VNWSFIFGVIAVVLELGGENTIRY
jgi:hypothetical protein